MIYRCIGLSQSPSQTRHSTTRRCPHLRRMSLLLLWGAQPLHARRSRRGCYAWDRPLRCRHVAEAGPVGQRAGRRKCRSRRSSSGSVRRLANSQTPRRSPPPQSPHQTLWVDSGSVASSDQRPGTARRSNPPTAEECGVNRMPMWLRTRARACGVGKRAWANRCPKRRPILNLGGRGRGPALGPPLRSSVRRQCAANAA